MGLPADDFGADYNSDWGPLSLMTGPLAILAHDIPTLGPIGVALTLGTTWQQVLPNDITRRAVWFHNPGAQNMRVAPANQAVQGNAGGMLIYPQEDLFLHADDEITNLGVGWMAWVDSGSNQPGTVLNFTGVNSSVPVPEPLATLRQQIPLTGPLGSGFSIGTSSFQIIGKNVMRRGIEFHNPGAVAISVCPANLTAIAGGAGSIVILPGAVKKIIARGRSRIRVNCGWNAIAQSGSANPITILEYV